MSTKIILGDSHLIDSGWDQVKSHWKNLAGESWFISDLYLALAQRFVRSAQLEDPISFYEATSKSGALYLANQQNLLESLFFSTVMSALTQKQIGTMIKIWLKEHWIGRMLTDAMIYPEFQPHTIFPYRLFYFNDAEPRSIFHLLDEMKSFMKEGASCMVHVEGTRAFSSKHRVSKMSDSVIRLAMDAGVPIIPVRFSGGLPAQDVEMKPIYPYRFVAQDIHIGQAIWPEIFANTTMKERKQLVIDAINSTGPCPDLDQLNDLNPEFESDVQTWAENAECAPEYAVLFQTLRNCNLSECSQDTLDVLAGRGITDWPDTPKGHWMAEWAGRLHGKNGRAILSRKVMTNG